LGSDWAVIGFWKWQKLCSTVEFTTFKNKLISQ